MTKNRYIFFLFFVMIFQLSYGQLDTSFGTSGVVTTSIDVDDIIYLSMLQTDSRIVVAGSTSSESITRAAVARYTVDGDLDTSFNTTGIQTTLIGSRTGARSVALQSDGKIVVSGYAFQSKTNIAVIRYNTNGSLDTTFNGTGFVTTSVGNGAVAHSVKIQPNGNIVVGGTSVSNEGQFMLAQYTSAGALDIFFGSSGIVLTPIGTHASIKQIALQADGKIVAAGFSHDGSVNKFALARYNTNGTSDGSFGSGGIVTTVIGTDARIQSIALQTDGKIVVAGFAVVSGIKQFVIARYNTDGSLDTNFNASGIVLTNIQDHSVAYAIAIQTDGKIVAGGYSISPNAEQFALARYTKTGMLDNTFGTNDNGIELTTVPLGSNGTHSGIMSLSIGLYILAAGFSESDFALAAYTI
jgi:uncharacterized delta-60 repeat protein